MIQSRDSTWRNTPLGKIWSWMQSTYSQKLQVLNFRSYFHWVTQISLCCDLDARSLAATRYKPSILPILQTRSSQAPRSVELKVPLKCNVARHSHFGKFQRFIAASSKAYFTVWKSETQPVPYLDTEQNITWDFCRFRNKIDLNTLLLNY